MRPIRLSLYVVLLLGLSVWMWRARGGAQEPLPAEPPVAVPATAPGDAVRPAAAGAGPAAAAGEQRTQAGQGPEELALLVVDAAGSPVGGAKLHLQHGDGRLRAGALTKHSYLRDSAGSELRGEGDAQGRVRVSGALDSVCSRSARSAWWIVAAGCQPLRVPCADDARCGLPATVVLARAEAVAVSVVHADGRSAAAARVHAVARAAGTSAERRAVPGMVLDAVADAAGLARLPRLEPGMAVWAETAGLHSLVQPVAATAQRVELVLLPSFTLRGRLDWSKCDAAEEACVSLKLVEGTRVHDLGAVPVRDDGSYGPVELPAHPCDRLYANVDAADALCDAWILEPAPVAGAALVHDFAMRPALWAPMLVYDAEKRPIAGALVKATNRQGPHRIVVEGVSDGEGRLRLGGLEAGNVEGSVTADGYAPFLYAFNLHRSGQLYEIPLVAGARLRGRVVRDGAPVSEFQLQWNDPSGAAQSKVVAGAADGAFELRSLPAEPLRLCAARDDGARSAWIEVDPRRGEEVLLELEEGGRVRGVVLDAADGRPLAGVELQLVARSQDRMAGGYGRTMRSDATGRFELEGARALETQLVAGLEGWMDHGLLLEERHIGGQDVELRLVRAAVLELSVEAGPWRGEGLLVHVGRGLASEPVRADGTVRFSGLPAGRVEALVEIGDLQLVTSRMFELRAGVVNRERIDLGEQPRVRIDFSGGARRSPLWTVEAVAGELRCANTNRPDTTFDLPLPGVPCELLVSDMEGVVLVLPLDAATAASGVVRIHVPDEFPRVRMVDARGEPVPLRTWVVLQQGAAAEQRLVVAAADDASIAPPYVAGTTVRALGTDLSTSIALAATFAVPDAGAPLRDVEVAPQAPLELVPAGDGDGGAGLALEVRVDWIPDALVVLRPAAGAEARLAAVSSGRYTVSWTGDEVWSGAVEVAQDAAGARVALDLRGLGSADIELRREGRPAEGVLLEAFDQRSGEAVGAWLARGAVRGSLQSGADGRVRLERLPRGSYRWRTTNAAGMETGGVFEVRARETTRLVLDLP